MLILVLQVDDDLIFIDEPTSNNVLGGLNSSTDQLSSSGVVNFIHGSLKRIKRSFWTFWDDGNKTTTTSPPPSTKSDTTLLR